MYQWNRNELLRRLNHQIKRVYYITTLNVLVGVIGIIILKMLTASASGILSIVLIGGLYLNHRRVLNSAKINLGIIYLNRRCQCSELAFFKHCEDGRLKCSLGYIDLEAVKCMIDRKAMDRNLNGRSIQG